jgi:hypothetical protein
MCYASVLSKFLSFLYSEVLLTYTVIIIKEGKRKNAYPIYVAQAGAATTTPLVQRMKRREVAVIPATGGYFLRLYDTATCDFPT